MLTFKLDTGADCNLLPLAIFQVAGKEVPLKKSSIKSVTLFSHMLVPLAMGKLKCEYKSEMHDVEFQIRPNLQAILGGDACTDMGMIKTFYKVITEEDTKMCSQSWGV